MRSQTERSLVWSVQLWAVVGGGLASWVAFKMYTGILPEDALITFRYAANLASGLGFAYNPGDVVLGTTTPLLTLFLTAAARLFGIAAIPTVATVSMIGASVVTAVLVALLIVQAGRDRRTALMGAAIFCIHPTTLWMTTGGMETPLVLLLMASSLYAVSAQRWNLVGCLLGLLVITRIDGVLWAVLILAVALFRERGRRLIGPAIAGGVIVAMWIVFATIHFGNPVPQFHAGAVNDIETPTVKTLESHRDRSSWPPMGRWNGNLGGAVGRPR